MIIFPLVCALLFSTLMWPLQVRFARRAPAFIAALGALVCVFAIFAALGIIALGCFRQARSRAPQYTDAARQEYSALQDWGAPRGIEFPLAGEIREVLQTQYHDLKTGASRELAFAGALVLLCAAAMSALDARRLRHWKERGAPRVLDQLFAFAEKLHDHFAARAERAILLGASTCAFTLWAGLDFSLVWGALAALLFFIPVFGAFFAALLPATWAFFQFHSSLIAMLVFLGGVLMQWLIGAFRSSNWRASRAISSDTR